ncbi:substrate of the Dot/Icm secretion system [Legionella gratiana]|uniref:Substrate of the Dot/Icm secretion system n=1 Tax=Legionella gratiana TaxID=45066 RepID=A0A378JE60_9GAMM|nr:hypothetical protein [Legionella gratiana]KTD06451.1 substrate of the Dot/Icm secretion system [Legionella gratiana]STX45271.1 substrate of the Dot/Icm secretion system [Legionella gratiana]
MSLSTLNIGTLLEQVTDKYLSRSDYAALRSSCILLSPVSDVTTEVQKELHRLLEIEKQTTAAQLTLEACEKQIQQDLQEKEQDYQENQKDLELISRLENELISVQRQKRLIDIELNELEVNMLRHESLIMEISRQIVLASHPESTQHTHTHPEPTQHTHTHPEPTQHTHTHPEPTQHTHTHPEPTQHTHTHPEPTQHTHSHPSTTDQLPKIPQIQPDTEHHHDHERESLELRKRTFSQELNQIKETLKSKQILSQKQQSRIEEITNRLNIELPEKQKQRNDRANARALRAQARLYDKTPEKELSSTNYRSLQKSIADAQEKLQKMQHQLMQKATEMSYQTFLTRLGYCLQSLNLSYQEKEALKRIVSNMEDYLLTQAEKQKQISIRHSAYLEKETLVHDIHQKENRVAQLKKTNPQLHAQNQALEEENQQLAHTIKERSTYRDYLLKIGLFGLLGSGISIAGGFLGMYMMPIALISICFAPAAVISFITVGFFIATLAYTLKNNSDTNQQERNKTTIQQNRTAISKQSGEIISLEQEILPSIKEKLSEVEKSLSLLDKKIKKLQHQAESLHHQAQQVMVTHAINKPFFSSETETRATINSTAIQLEEVQRNTRSC